VLQLPQSCTSVVVWGAAFDYYAAGVVARLTKLRDLSWSKSLHFTGTCLGGLAQSVSQCSLQRYPEDSANPMQDPGPNPCPALVTHGATSLPQVSPTTCRTQAELASNMYKA
jgi:hypothetical protein